MDELLLLAFALSLGRQLAQGAESVGRIDVVVKTLVRSLNKSMRKDRK